MRVSVDEATLSAVRLHARRARPTEACGLLAGTTATREAGALAQLDLVHYVPMRNIATHPERGFEMDPVDIARADHSLRVAGLSLAAVFHSHPDSSATPSLADARAAWPGLVQLIAGADGSLGAWLPSGDALVPATLVLTPTHPSL
jgi:proteasome lid subunit RPN8/RPN11